MIYWPTWNLVRGNRFNTKPLFRAEIPGTAIDRLERLLFSSKTFRYQLTLLTVKTTWGKLNKGSIMCSFSVTFPLWTVAVISAFLQKQTVTTRRKLLVLDNVFWVELSLYECTVNQKGSTRSGLRKTEKRSRLKLKFTVKNFLFRVEVHLKPSVCWDKNIEKRC